MLRKLLLVLAVVLAAILVVVVSGFGYALTPFGQRQLAGLLESQLSGPGQRAELRGLSLQLPFDLRLAAFRLSDEQGTWLEVDDARVELRPSALLRAQIVVDNLGARRVELARLPPAAPEPAAKAPFSLPQLPALPRSLPPVTIGHLYIEALELGQPAAFAISGKAGTGSDGRQAEVDLALRRTDQATAALDLAAGLDLASGRLHLDAKGSETGGLLASVTGRPQAGALRLALAGDGPLADWRGSLDVEAEHLAKLGLDVELAYAAERHIGLAGTLDAEPGALPEEVAAIVGTRADLKLRAGEIGPQRFALQELGLQAGHLSLTGHGDADLGADSLRGELALDLPDLQPLSAMAGTPLGGSMVARLAAAGAAQRPDLHLAVDGTDLAAANVAVGSLGLVADVGFTAPLGAGPVALRAQGDATIAGLAWDGRPVGDAGRAGLAFAGELPASGAVRLDRLALRSSLLELTAHGAIDRDSLAGSARLDATVPRLADVAEVLGIDPATAKLPVGTLRLGADATVAPHAERIEVALDGGASELAGLPPGVQELIGAAPTLQVRAAVEPGRTAVVDGLTLQGQGIRLEGEPRYGFADQSLGGELRLAIPDLRPLAGAIGRPIAGAAKLRAALGHTIAAPEVTLDGVAEGVAVAGQSFDALSLAADARGPVDALAGKARLAASRAKSELSLSTGYALSGRQLRLSGITLEGPATRLAGDVELSLDRPLATGQLAGEIRDLAALAPWVGQKLAGAATVDLRLVAPEGRQDVVAKLGASGIAGDFGTLRTASLDASLRDALGRGSVDAALVAEGFAAPDLAVDQVKVEATGLLADLAVTLATAGKQAGQPFDVAAAAGLDVLGPRKTVRLNSLGGTLVGQKLQLMRPTTVVLAGQAVTVEPIDLQLGAARAQAEFRLDEQRVTGGLTLNELALAALEPFGVPPLAGKVQAKLDLAGSPRAPVATLAVDVRQLALDPAAKAKTDATLEAKLGNGRLDADLRASGLGSAPLAARATLPVTFGLRPFAFAMDQGASLTGGVVGPVDLGRAASFAALEGIQLQGVLQLAIDLAGSLDRPQVGGTLALAGGSVQDVTSGFVLRNMKLRVRGAGDRLLLEEFGGTDPTGGTLAGAGNVGLLPGGGMSFDVAVNANRARVLENELGTIVLSGEVGVSGDLTGAAVRGKLTVDRGDLEIPDKTGGPSVPVMQVTEINRATAAAPPPRNPGPPFALSFDVGIEIPSRFFVRGRGLDSEWGGSLQLKGDLADPQVLGELDVQRGFFDLLNRRFTIGRGAVDFVGTRPPVPMIDLEATAQTVDVTVTVDLKGPAADPKLTLTSDPTLPQDEILSRLLFGTSVARVTPMQGLRLAAAAQQLQGGGVVSDVLTTLRRAAGLDTLDVQSGETSQESTARAGKYISDKVYVEVQRGVADGSGKASVRVDLTPQLSVGTSVNEQSQTGVGLQWKWDY